MDSEPYFGLMTTLLVVLIGIAVWQFCSLVWGDPFGISPSIATLPSR
jgi:hypothetical protein